MLFPIKPILKVIFLELLILTQKNLHENWWLMLTIGGECKILLPVLDAQMSWHLASKYWYDWFLKGSLQHSKPENIFPIIIDFWFLMSVWIEKYRKEPLNDLMVANDLLVAILNKELFQNVTPKYASIEQ